LILVQHRKPLPSSRRKKDGLDRCEELAAYAKRLLEQLDFMIDRLQKQREALRKVLVSP
jgi:hypothetical protein